MYYKLARSDGWDFHTGKTINYRDSIGKRIYCPRYNKNDGICSSGVLHASKDINDCFQGETTIPCSAYVIEGKAVIRTPTKCGFKSLRVAEEIVDLDCAFGWQYSEAIHPVNPFAIVAPASEKMEMILGLLQIWDSVGASVWDSVGASVGASVGDSVWASVRASVGASVWASIGDSVWASVGASVWASVGDSVGASVGDSVWASVRDSVRDSVWASVGAYIGSIFPKIKIWKYTKTEVGIYPFQSAVDLWKMGIIPSWDGEIWRLHSGPQAEIMWSGEMQELSKDFSKGEL